MYVLTTEHERLVKNHNDLNEGYRTLVSSHNQLVDKYNALSQEHAIVLRRLSRLEDAANLTDQPPSEL